MLLHQQFVRIAKQYEKKLAIVDRTLDRRVTYERALIGALILTKKFQKFAPGFVGIMLPNTAGSVLAILGTLMSGRVPVMINYSTGAQANCEFAQKKCAFKTIITSKALCEKINCRKIEGMVFLEDIMKSVSFFDKIKAAFKAKLPVESLLKKIHGGDENDTLLILFTSGSEKEPKGVQLTHRNISSNYKSLKKAYSFSTEDIFLANLPYFHVFGQTANLWVPLSEGMTIVTYANPLDHKTVCEIVREEKVTLMAGTPTFFWGYLRSSKPGDFDSVRILLSGADKCPDALRQAFMEKHHKTLLEAYGTTETSPAITVNTLEHNRPGSVGTSEGGCPNALTGLDALRRKIEALLRNSARLAPGQYLPPGQTHAFRPLRITLAACPNACTQPQARAIGLIASVRPRRVTTDCTSCSQCAAVCRESALNADGGVAKLDAGRCVGCGQCATVCAHGALDLSALGFRMLVGGRMGRHPRFASELPFLLRPDDVPEAVGRVLAELVCNAGETEPLSAVAARMEPERLLQAVAIPSNAALPNLFPCQAKGD